MKKIIIVFLLTLTSSVFAQKGKPTFVDSVLLDSNTLYQFIGGQQQARGSVISNHDQSLFYDPVWGSYFSAGAGTKRTGSGRWNVVIGEGAGDNITSLASYNTLIGAHVGNAITSGRDNVFMGWDAGLFTTTGSGNVGFPEDALKYNISGSDNIAIGKFSQYTHTNGLGNVSIGFNTLYYLNKGDENVVIGKYAGGIFKNGSGNVFLGRYTGECNQPETDSTAIDDAIAIGSYTGLSKMFSKTITIGYNLQPTAPNKINIGDVFKGDITTGNAEVKSISISGRKITFDDNYMYVETSTGVKKVALQDLLTPAASPAPATTKQIVGYKAFDLQTGRWTYIQPIYSK